MTPADRAVLVHALFTRMPAGWSIRGERGRIVCSRTLPVYGGVTVTVLRNRTVERFINRDWHGMPREKSVVVKGRNWRKRTVDQVVLFACDVVRWLPDGNLEFLGGRFGPGGQNHGSNRGYAAGGRGGSSQKLTTVEASCHGWYLRIFTR